MSRSAVALVGLLLVTAPAFAHGRRAVVVQSAYYYPVYAYRVPFVSVPAFVMQAPVACPVPVAVTPPPAVFATPTPAPPSKPPVIQSIEPPLQPIPKKTESRFYAGPGTSAPPVITTSTDGGVRVGFWNVTGRDVTLTVDGRPRLLPRNRSVTLDLSRRFTWHIDREAPRTEQVPADRPGLEIVLRP
jgi:hypothetical protein